MRITQSRKCLRRGAVVVYVAVCMVALLSVLALTLDGGGLFEKRRHVQAGADAAALSAAVDLYQNFWNNSGADPEGSAQSSALATAAANGFLEGGDTTVTVNIPPASGRYEGIRGYAEVIIEYKQRRGFSNIFASGPIPVRARAVALGSPIAADVGILVLHPTQRSALNAQGGGMTDVKDTPVVVNSNDSAAAIVGGGSVVAAPEILIKGNYSTSGGGSFEGDIKINRPGMDDPLLDLPVPDPTSMIVRSPKKLHTTSATLDLSPGVYKGGISVAGTGNLNLAPGIYYMQGGGFSFSGQGSLRGEGVMIYNAPGSGNSDGINVKGQGSLYLTPPTSGVYHGLTFFQNRNSSVTGHVEGAGGTTYIQGTFYFAGALLNIRGNGGVSNVGSQYISNLLDLGGNGAINIDWQPEYVARRRSIFLVE